MDFITGDSVVAKKLRHKFIFKLIPMLNPDGVIVGNTRSSLTGRDLNRQYRTVIRETYPSIWNTKAMIKRLMEDCGVSMYCDMHAHSRKHNIFIYGCENLKRHPDRRLLEQVFPLMLHKNVADKVSESLRVLRKMEPSTGFLFTIRPQTPGIANLEISYLPTHPKVPYRPLVTTITSNRTKENSSYLGAY